MDNKLPNFTFVSSQILTLNVDPSTSPPPLHHMPNELSQMSSGP